MAAVRQTPLSCPGHTRPIVDLDFSDSTPHGYFLISACKDGKPMLRQGATGDWIGTFEGHKGAVWGASLNKQATRAATGAADFTAKVWDAVSGEELHTFSHKHIVKSVNFSEENNNLLTGSNEKIIRIFDLDKPEADPIELKGHEGSIRSAKWCHNSKRILSVAEDKTIRVWDVSSASEIRKIEMDSSSLSLDITYDGSVFVVCSGKSVTFWDLNTFEQLKKFTAPTLLYSASLHVNKEFYVAGGDDFKLYKCSYEDGSELESYKGHFGPVHCVRFSPDGEIYASGSEDGTLRLWQTTVGKTYGLWKWVDPSEIVEDGQIEVTQSPPQAVRSED